MLFLQLINPIYLVPYTLTIIVGLLSVLLWYYKIQYKDGLSTSYNAEISASGKNQLFDEVFENYGSLETDSTSTKPESIIMKK